MKKKAKPKPDRYYDWIDIKEYFKFNEIEDLIDCDDIFCNGILKTIYKPEIPEDDWDEENLKMNANQWKVFNEFGEIKIHFRW